MGCQYIEGACINNPIYNLAAREGLLRAPLKRVDPARGIFCTSDGRALDTPISLMAYHAFKQIEHEAASLFHLGCGKTHGSLLNFFSKFERKILKDRILLLFASYFLIYLMWYFVPRKLQQMEWCLLKIFIGIFRFENPARTPKISRRTTLRRFEDNVWPDEHVTT